MNFHNVRDCLQLTSIGTTNNKIMVTIVIIYSVLSISKVLCQVLYLATINCHRQQPCGVQYSHCQLQLHTFADRVISFFFTFL